MSRRPSNAAFATVTAAVLGVAGLLSIAVWTGVLGAVVGLDDTDGSVAYVIGTLAVAPGAATVAALYVIGASRGVDYLDLRRPSRRDAGYAVGGAVILLGLNILADAVLGLFGVEVAGHNLVSAIESDPELVLVLLPLAYASVGPGEELLFRNVIQKSLYDAFSRRWAIVVASLVFAAVHFTAYAGRGDPLFAVGVSLALVFALSMVLGVVYERTGNLLVPAFAHATYDAAVYAILYVDLVGLP